MVITHQNHFLIALDCIISFLPICQIFCWARYASNQNCPLSCHCRTYLTVKERMRKQICSCAQARLRHGKRGAICCSEATGAWLTSELPRRGSHKASVCTGKSMGKSCYPAKYIFMSYVSIYWWNTSTYSCCVWNMGRKTPFSCIDRVYLLIHTFRFYNQLLTTLGWPFSPFQISESQQYCFMLHDTHHLGIWGQTISMCNFGQWNCFPLCPSRLLLKVSPYNGAIA